MSCEITERAALGIAVKNRKHAVTFYVSSPLIMLFYQIFSQVQNARRDHVSNDERNNH